MEYGGISVSRILNEADPIKQKNLFFTYAKHIPRGDLFWHLVMSRSFFGQFALVDEDGISLKDPIIASLLKLQHSIALDLFITPEGKDNQSRDIIEVISEYHRFGKPILVVSTGGNFTRVLRDALVDEGVCTFEFPEHAVKALSKLVEYYKK